MSAGGSVFTSRSSDAPRSRLLDLHARWPERYPALLESAAHAGSLGRFDLLFAVADLEPALVKLADGSLRQASTRQAGGSFLESFAQLFEVSRRPAVESSLPFSGGWLIFVGYEIAGEIEASLQLPPSPDAIQAAALRVPAAFIYDHRLQRLHLIAESEHAGLIERMSADLQSCPGAPAAAAVDISACIEDAPAIFLDGLHRAKDHIRAGDVYQVNLSRGWQARAIADGARSALPIDVYRALRAANPAPFAASLVLGDLAVLSSSPERLFSVRDGQITTRPIAGTRPRSRQPGADANEMALLAAHPKERAEHVMLIDLERNDLGRICEPGSVRVDEFMVLESYEHVHHIVSNVCGRLQTGVTAAQILRAVFPGGTITGCPKIRCMQIIAQLEGVGRGAYTGSLGYLNHDGSGDLNILIRTMTLSIGSGEIRFRAGAGIVADSDPQRELEETRAKARGLLRALGQST